MAEGDAIGVNSPPQIDQSTSNGNLDHEADKEPDFDDPVDYVDNISDAGEWRVGDRLLLAGNRALSTWLPTTDEFRSFTL